MTVAINNTVVALVVCANTILLVPNIIDLALVLDELNIPVVKLYPPKSNVPDVSVVVPVDVKVNAAAKVVVPEVLLIVNANNEVFPFEVIVPVPTIVAVNAVYVPPLANVNEFTFTVVVAGVLVVPVKSNILNQLPEVIVGIDAPEVNLRLGALVDEPPVVPNVNVLVTDKSAVNPPVPV